MTTSTLVDDALCTDVKANDFEPCNEVPFNLIRPSFGLLIKYYAVPDRLGALSGMDRDAVVGLLGNVRSGHQET
jgi:hypothetical protein